MRKLGRSAIEKIHFNRMGGRKKGGGGLSAAQLRHPTIATSSWIIHRSASRNGRVLPCNISITIFLLLERPTSQSRVIAMGISYLSLVSIRCRRRCIVFPDGSGELVFLVFQQMHSWVGRGDVCTSALHRGI